MYNIYQAMCNNAVNMRGNCDYILGVGILLDPCILGQVHGMKFKFFSETISPRAWIFGV